MDDVKGAAGLPATVVFRLGTLGTLAGDRFAEKIEAYDLKVKHAGLMTVLSLGPAVSQQDLAAKMGVAPSLVVSLADHLETLGAVQRVRDPQDRRRQVLTLTAHGRELLEKCAAEARALDEEFTAALTPDQAAALGQALAVLTAQAGLP
ncbi:MarR family winged helix-turn-helix transcriptional regulator [Planotetraspora phitsanulokensis]|nr:MarR family winged helix-turn-helix transcriptional regulator [Planotetraspora phitsanulokensis]